jgi:hypothetical protein
VYINLTMNVLYFALNFTGVFNISENHTWVTALLMGLES